MSPEDALAAEKQSTTTFNDLNMLNTSISLTKCVHCRFVVLHECSFAEHWPIHFLQTVLLVSIPLLYFHVANGVRVYLSPLIHTEVSDREVYTPSGAKISLLQAKA